MKIDVKNWKTNQNGSWRPAAFISSFQIENQLQKNAMKMQVSLMNETIYHFSAVKYNIWKLPVVLMYSNLIPSFSMWRYLFKCQKWYRYHASWCSDFVLKAFTRINPNENELIELTRNVIW